tara:strand:+ start:140 stop:427 length:288 start_codon:yes stop_codon:yes gene_type:complete
MNADEILTGNYIDIEAATERLKTISPDFTITKVKKYAEPNSKGVRKLPFIKCRLSNKLIIDVGIISVIEQKYRMEQLEALKEWRTSKSEKTKAAR